MIEFKPVELNDKEWIKPLLKAADFGGCHQNFTNIFAWRETYHYHVAKVENFLVVKGNLNGTHYYFYPAGSGDVHRVLEELRQDAQDNNHDFILLGISPANMAELKELYPDNFEYEAMRDSFDYVYLAEKLATLAGRKLQAKRNHINRFVANNPNWSFEVITPDNLAECWEMNLEWCRLNNCGEDEQLQAEYCAVKNNFKYFRELELEGGLIRVDGKIVAFTIGERLNSDTYVVHVEKAFGDIQGAYQIINREFVRWIRENYPDIVYVNREEDMGYEGLRKAKLSYHPDKMEEKYLAKYYTVK